MPSLLDATGVAIPATAWLADYAESHWGWSLIMVRKAPDGGLFSFAALVNPEMGNPPSSLADEVAAAAETASAATARTEAAAAESAKEEASEAEAAAEEDARAEAAAAAIMEAAVLEAQQQTERLILHSTAFDLTHFAAGARAREAAVGRDAPRVRHVSRRR